MARNRYDVSRIMVNGKDVFTLQLRMSAFGGKADMFQGVAKSPLIAISGQEGYLLISHQDALQ